MIQDAIRSSVSSNSAPSRGDDVAHERTRDDQVDIEAEEVVEDRLRKPVRAGALVAPLETRVNHARILEFEIALLAVSDDADDARSAVTVIRCGPRRPAYLTLDRIAVQRYRVRLAHGLAWRALFGESVRITDPDHAIRRAALEHVRRLAREYDDLVPRTVLLEGFWFAGERWSLGSLQNGIYRPRRFAGPAALTLLTAAHAPGQPAPYDDDMDPASGTILYHYRAGSIDQPDNRALCAAFAEQVPLIYFMGVAPGQLVVVAPVYVTSDDPSARVVTLEVGLPIADTTPAGLVSAPDVRAYAMQDVRIRLHQQRFRINVLRAYRERCAICALKEPELVQAAHIVEDASPEGIAAVVNGIALCAIHHLAYDRNLLGIDPSGVVHIAGRLLNEIDGPMLTTGLQGFHGKLIGVPRRPADRPDPARLQTRFERFVAAA